MMLTATSLRPTFKRFHHVSRYVVAFSGGLDSTVLLHLMHALNLPLQAVHVNHHLQPHCDQWERHCEKICDAWDIAFSVRHVEIEKISGKSVEEEAREVRYRELAEFVGKQDTLVTAHHKNDLVETLMLQLLRGAGPAGLAAMSAERNLITGSHLRPLLDYKREELLEYAQQHTLHWIADESNDSLEFDRNYLRKEIIPRLIARWPGTLQTIARAADLQAHAVSCLWELANLDVRAAATDDSRVLNVKVLQELSHARLSNALRGWIRDHAIRVPNQKLLDHIITDVVRKDEYKSSPVQTWGEGEIRRYRNRIYLMQPLPAHDCNQQYQWKIDQPLYIASLNLNLQPVDLSRCGVMLPENARELSVRFRCGGERFRLPEAKHHKSLKKMFQEAGVPPWKRGRIPLLYYNDQLVSVLGYWNASVYHEIS